MSEASDVFVIRTVEGKGWVRELVDGAPIIVSAEREAFEWATRTEANRVLASIARLGDRVPMRVERRAPTPGGPYQFVP